MKDIQFPIVKTKMDGREFDLTDTKDRQAYFEYKAGPEIAKLKKYLEKNTFIAYLLGKKSSGKGTYAKMFKEIVAPDKVEHVSIGDMIRSFDEVLKDEAKTQELIAFLKKKYRGPVSVEDIIKAMQSRSTKVLLPSELILALTERTIASLGKKAIFLDGFPRDIDQVSYSLFFKALVDYRQDPDVFVLIDVPTQVIDERMKYRVVCPICQTSRNTKLLPTRHVGYDKEKNVFFLMCDNSACSQARMVTKEGDEFGIEPIKGRLQKDEDLMKQVYAMHGIEKALLRSSVPQNQTQEFFDDYEVTPEYQYSVNEKTGEIITNQKPWQVQDDEGVTSNSLMPPPVVVSLIKQMVAALGL